MALNPNHAESEFDDLLDRLTNQLALTPVTPPELVQDQQLEAVPEPRLRPDSVPDVVSTAEGARGIDPIVKIVGILTGSLTVVAVAALIVLGGGEPSTVAAGLVEDRGAGEQVAVAAAEQREAAERAHADARNFARLAEHEHVLRHEAQRLQREQAALAAEQAAKTKKSKRKRRRRSATKRPSTGTDFDML